MGILYMNTHGFSFQCVCLPFGVGDGVDALEDDGLGWRFRFVQTEDNDEPFLMAVV